MQTVPQKFMVNRRFPILYGSELSCILHKNLQLPLRDAHSFVSTGVLSMVLSGEQQIRTYDGSTIKVPAGDAVFLPKDLYMISDLFPEGGFFESLVFFFDPSLIANFLKDSQIQKEAVQKASGQENQGPIHLSAGPELNLFGRGIVQLMAGRPPEPPPSLVNIKLSELLHLLYRQTGSRLLESLQSMYYPDGRSPRSLKEFMEANFLKPLKLEDYAYLSGRSLSTFRRDFRRIWETSPAKWLRNRRLDYAHEALLGKGQAAGGKSVTDVALEVGYENPSHFISEFKKRFGSSPKQMMIQKREKALQ